MSLTELQFTRGLNEIPPSLFIDSPSQLATIIKTFAAQLIRLRIVQ
jgi:hypothetical protein